MARVSVIPPEKARPGPLPAACSGSAATQTYLDGDSSLHLHLLELAADASLHIERGAIDRVIYVWRGAVEVGGHRLMPGSSIVVEHGRELVIRGREEQSQLLLFAAANASVQSRSGGHVHVLPAEHVPRMQSATQAGSVAGGMHADAQCATCEVWLHENSFPGSAGASPEEEARGIHSHTEDEIIFVVAGQMRLGGRLSGPGTALAIAANTLYGFTPGPEGLHFINFRAGMPGDIRFANGGSMSETEYWRERVARPQYIEI